MAVFRAGDIVYRRKGLVRHKGLVLHDGRVLHNTPERGEHISHLSEFGAGKRIWLETRTGSYSGTQLSTRSLPDRGRNYHLLTNNCEHTISRATNGRAESPQLKSWLAGIGLGTVTFALTRHPGATAAAYALGRSLGRRLNRGR